MASSYGQEDMTHLSFGRRIFLPTIDVGYQWPRSNLMEAALNIKTTIEYPGAKQQ